MQIQFRYWLPVMIVLAVAMGAQGLHAQASQNPHSAYAACHGGSPPGWCAHTCGNPDIWCEFAGFRCYMDNPFFDMIPGVKDHELLSEKLAVADDGWSVEYWADSSQAAKMEDYMTHLAAVQCTISTGLSYAACVVGITTFSNPPNCSTAGSGWEDWHCVDAQSPTFCRQRGI